LVFHYCDLCYIDEARTEKSLLLMILRTNSTRPHSGNANKAGSQHDHTGQRGYKQGPATCNNKHGPATYCTTVIWVPFLSGSYLIDVTNYLRSYLIDVNNYLHYI
jgi:hypothetical protein